MIAYFPMKSQSQEKEKSIKQESPDKVWKFEKNYRLSSKSLPWAKENDEEDIPEKELGNSNFQIFETYKNILAKYKAAN